jgi:hypothetical protein
LEERGRIDEEGVDPRHAHPSQEAAGVAEVPPGVALVPGGVAQGEGGAGDGLEVAVHPDGERRGKLRERAAEVAAAAERAVEVDAARTGRQELEDAVREDRNVHRFNHGDPS